MLCDVRADVAGETMQLATRPGYRAEIDGLRAVAVLSVVAFHYGAPLRGGFTGVDVFFVISGFLITQIIAGEIAAGTFSVIGFYDRRMRRILPALLTMLACVLLAGKFLLMPGDYASLASSSAAAAFGASNFYFLAHTGYFDQVAELLPLLHSWSLAVEEQFYLVWPLLLLGLAAVGSRSALAAILAVIVTVGCAASIVYFHIDPKSAFYMALPRAWELALGALLAFLPALPVLAGEVAAVVGLSLIGAGFFVVASWRFPGPSALYPCVGAALVIWPRAQITISGRLLGLLAPIGLISYSLYLWHWPIWVYFRIYLEGGNPSAAQAMALATVSIAISALSYRYVERPFRKPRWTAPRTVAAGLASIMVIFCASMYVDSSDGLPQRLPPDAQAMRSLQVMWDWPCPETTRVSGIPGGFCTFGAPWQSAKRKTMIWGDSHAQHFAPIFDAINTDHDRAFLVYVGCSAVLDENNYITIVGAPTFRERCQRFHANGIKIIMEDDAIDQLVITSNWLDLPVRIGKGDVEYGLHAIRTALLKLFNETSRPGRRYLLMGTVPQLPREVVECGHQTSSALLRAPCTATIGPVDARTIRQKTDFIDAVFVELAKTVPHVTAVIPAEKLCRSDGCDVSLDDEFLWRDLGHIRRNLRLKTRRDFADRIGLTAALADDRQKAAAQTGPAVDVRTR
jgi:peptidoglycan/LPS O-acetylase OafA/YrhL